MMKEFDYLKKLINLSWSKDTCYPKVKDNWNKNNPSYGQCAITALVVQDFFDGKIMRCKVDNVSHYYNLINDTIIDLTKDQFNDIIFHEKEEEINRSYLISNLDTYKRYHLLLNNMKKNISNLDNYYENMEEIKLNSIENKIKNLAMFYGIEINNYQREGLVEQITFDLTCYTTGNIFTYSHNLETDEYYKVKSDVYTWNNYNNINIPIEYVKELFNIAIDKEIYKKFVRKIGKR